MQNAPEQPGAFVTLELVPNAAALNEGSGFQGKQATEENRGLSTRAITVRVQLPLGYNTWVGIHDDAPREAGLDEYARPVAGLDVFIGEHRLVLPVLRTCDDHECLSYAHWFLRLEESSGVADQPALADSCPDVARRPVGGRDILEGIRCYGVGRDSKGTADKLGVLCPRDRAIRMELAIFVSGDQTPRAQVGNGREGPGGRGNILEPASGGDCLRYKLADAHDVIGGLSQVVLHGQDPCKVQLCVDPRREPVRAGAGRDQKGAGAWIGLFAPHAQPWTGTAGRGEKRCDCGKGSRSDGGRRNLILLDLGDSLLREDVLAGPDTTLQEHSQEPGIVLGCRACSAGHVWIPVEPHQVEACAVHAKRLSDADTEKFLPCHSTDHLADAGSHLDGNRSVTHGGTGQSGHGSSGDAFDTFLQRQCPVGDRSICCRQSGIIGPKLSYCDCLLY